MLITNNFSLPSPLVRAVSEGIRKPEPGRISCTELIDSPQIRVLKMKHWDELTQDVSDLLWALLGKAVHAVLEASANENCLVEEGLETEIDGWTLIGRPDLLDHEGVLQDWKITSVFSFLLGEKESWTNQILVYKWLYGRYGFEIKEEYINAILRDWHRSKVGGDYPERPFFQKRVELLPDDKIEEYIKIRLKQHKEAEEGHITDCNKIERWARPDTWAVIKKGKKRAERVFETMEEAEDWQCGSPLMLLLSITHRPGENIRCERYCLVKNFCNQYAEMQMEKELVIPISFFVMKKLQKRTVEEGL